MDEQCSSKISFNMTCYVSHFLIG